jgi:hypothetical protein
VTERCNHVVVIPTGAGEDEDLDAVMRRFLIIEIRIRLRKMPQRGFSDYHKKEFKW